MAITIHRPKKMIRKKSDLVRGFTTDPVMSPMDLPSWRIDRTRAPKSCTAPAKIDPKTTQSRAGTHPHITPSTGPTMGPVPAIDVKW